ncbi:unnamed protein product [Caenorhabditis sp. 36 PRJEB53466]|nr:unnamed protein product [Caenorhabditis sp. 36 PRJEB53466]
MYSQSSSSSSSSSGNPAYYYEYSPSTGTLVYDQSLDAQAYAKSETPSMYQNLSMQPDNSSSSSENTFVTGGTQHYFPHSNRQFTGYPVLMQNGQMPMESVVEQQQEYKPFVTQNMVHYDPTVYDFGVNNYNQMQNQPMNYDEVGQEEQVRDPKAQSKRPIKKVSLMHTNTSCVNCGTRDTTLWRRSDKGEAECNPCNLYFRTKGVKRPQSLWNKPTLGRKRRPVAVIVSNGEDQ